jgi:hypothetical protein
MTLSYHQDILMNNNSLAVFRTNLRSLRRVVSRMNHSIWKVLLTSKSEMHLVTMTTEKTKICAKWMT